MMNLWEKMLEVNDEKEVRDFYILAMKQCEMTDCEISKEGTTVYIRRHPLHLCLQSWNIYLN